MSLFRRLFARPGQTEAHLAGAFGDAAPEQFVWQTEALYVADQERRLVREAFLPLGDRVLDLGCAEGATLLHLDAHGVTGLDLFEDKLAFARTRLPDCRFVQGSAYELPFEDGSFDHVIVRDVVHHLDRPEVAVREIARVLAPGGRCDVLEPCRNNPLILLHALTNAAERGELRSTGRYLGDLLSTRLSVERVAHHQALPVHRLVFHPKLGRPALAQNVLAREAVALAERLAALALPEEAWAYVSLRATKRA